MVYFAQENTSQPLVPSAIRDFLRAGIRVWMITGDKLEAAKNIGLACNLLDPDMMPQFDSQTSLEDCIERFHDQRLLEVTGQWASLCRDTDEMKRLFTLLDADKDGRLNRKELTFTLKYLEGSIMADRVDVIFEAYCDEDNCIDQQRFVEMMHKSAVSPHEAIAFDIQEAIRRYNEIKDHDTYPVSVLVNREAFRVLFPDPKDRKLSVDQSEEALAAQEELLETLREQFFWLTSVSKSVVFARAEPAMKKRMVVEIQRRKPNAVTLAIGDGANDTDMITAAHVGVGIAGVEGTAATNSADYAIGSFRMLHSLLLVHGFWSYQRISMLVYLIFYKASLLALTAYFFGFHSGFSGQQFFNDPIYQLYNIVFTSLPVMALSLFDRLLPADVLENNPSVFREARAKAFTKLQFGTWIMRAVVRVASYCLCLASCARTQVHAHTHTRTCTRARTHKNHATL